MRVIGVTPTSKGYNWVILEGSSDEPVLVDKCTRDEAITNTEESNNLLNLKRTVASIYEQYSIDKVVILKSSNTIRGNLSIVRVKVECIFQVAAAEIGVARILLVHSKTLNTLLGKLEKRGQTLDEIKGVINTTTPSYLDNSLSLAWTHLE